jgi:hypothetical protein
MYVCVGLVEEAAKVWTDFKYQSNHNEQNSKSKERRSTWKWGSLTVMLPDTEYAIKTAINVGIIICNWPVISNTTTAVEMVCVAPDTRDAAPTTAYAPGNTLSST